MLVCPPVPHSNVMQWTDSASDLIADSDSGTLTAAFSQCHALRFGYWMRPSGKLPETCQFGVYRISGGTRTRTVNQILMIGLIRTGRSVCVFSGFVDNPVSDGRSVS